MIPPGICAIKMNPVIHHKSHTWCQYCSVTPKFHWEKKNSKLLRVGEEVPWNTYLDASPQREHPIGAEQPRIPGAELGWAACSIIKCCSSAAVNCPPCPFWVQEALGHSESCPTRSGAAGRGCSPNFLNSCFTWPAPVESPPFIGDMMINIKTTTNVCSKHGLQSFFLLLSCHSVFS